MPKLRMTISDFEFVDNFWNIQVPPNLRPIENDEIIRPMLMCRVEFTARLGLFNAMSQKEETKSQTKIAPFSHFAKGRCPDKK